MVSPDAILRAVDGLAARGPADAAEARAVLRDTDDGRVLLGCNLFDVLRVVTVDDLLELLEKDDARQRPGR